MSAFLTALFPNIVSTLIFEGSKAAYQYIQSKKTIESRIKKAFEKALRKFYAEPDYCGRESLRKFEEYKNKLRQTFFSDTAFIQSVQYQKLYELFEAEVLKDSILRVWLIFQNSKYVKGSLDAIFRDTQELRQGQERIETGMQCQYDMIREIHEHLVGHANNSVVQAILPNLQEAVTSLRLVEAHDMLEKIRVELANSSQLDFALLSRVDFQMGRCSRYQNAKRAVTELRLAYSEMIEGKSFNLEIAEGGIIAAMLDGRKFDEAGEICKYIKDNDVNSLWCVIIDFLTNRDYSIITNLSDEDKDIAVANMLCAGISCDLNKFFELRTYEYNIPETFDIITLPKWILYLNVATSKYFSFVGYDFYGKRTAGDIVKDLKDITDRFISLSTKAQIGDLFPDVHYMNIAMAFEIDKKAEHIEEYEDCSHTKDNNDIYEILHAAMLSAVGRKEDSLEALERCKGSDKDNRPVIIELLKCTLAIAHNWQLPAAEAFEEMAKGNYVLESSMIGNPLVCLVNWNDTVGSYLPNIKFAAEKDRELFEAVSSCLSNRNGNVSSLVKLYPNQTEQVKCLIAVACFHSGNLKAGIELLRQDIDDSTESMINIQYAELLSKGQEYSVEEYDFLKRLREKGNSTPELLNREYLLAVQCSDFSDALLVANKIREMFPASTRAYVAYLNIVAQMGDADVMRNELTKIMSTEFVEDEIDAVVGILERFHYDAEAVELMYRTTMKYSNVKWKDFYCLHTYSTPLGNFVNMDVPSVQRDSFVFLKVDGEDETRRIDMTVNQVRYASLIGARANSKFKVRLDGQDREIEVVNIKSKYFKLQHDILDEISKGVDGYSMKMFKADDMISSGDPLGWLAKMAGLTDEDRVRHEENAKAYESGTQSIIPMLRNDKIAAEYYNKLFGDFEVLNFPVQFYLSILKNSEVELSAYEFVLDISSVMILYELRRRFDYKPSFKMVVPKGLRDMLQNTKTLQECNLPAMIEKVATDRTQMDIGINPFSQRLKDIVEWIDGECDVVVVENKLLIAQGLHYDNFFSVEVESILLSYENNRCLVTEDWGLMGMIKGLKSINLKTVVTILDKDCVEKVASFLNECHFREVTTQ